MRNAAYCDVALWRSAKGLSEHILRGKRKERKPVYCCCGVATANGVANGTGNGKFVSEGKITREQMATILFR